VQKIVRARENTTNVIMKTDRDSRYSLNIKRQEPPQNDVAMPIIKIGCKHNVNRNDESEENRRGNLYTYTASKKVNHRL
jgi:hypothetical protein